MSLQPFTKNFTDHSTEAGFQFTFFCDSCHEGFKSSFIESKTYKKTSFMKNITNIIGFGAQVMGRHDVDYTMQRGRSLINSYLNMTPQWHKEHDIAFNSAQNEVQGSFKRCPKCKLWVCPNDWNDDVNLCVEDAPRQSVEMASARANKIIREIQSKVSNTQLYTDEVKETQTLCPACNKPTNIGKFCSNCGNSLQQKFCSSCGTPNQPTNKFCSGCGGKII